jgi:hypothetical protein
LKYYTDKNKVYVIDTERKPEDNEFLFVFEVFTESFRVFPQKHFSRDNYNIYYQNQIVEHADPEGFTPIAKDYSKDGQYIFYKDKILHGVDYHTFRVFEDSDDFDARDTLNYYLKGKKVRVNK